MNHRYFPPAIEELEESLAYYYSIDPDIARRFKAEIDRLIVLICSTPRIFRSRRNGVRRANLKRFPHYLMFAIRDEMIQIIAVAHSSRRPDYWLDRLPDLK